jgi:hypothetical protein
MAMLEARDMERGPGHIVLNNPPTHVLQIRTTYPNSLAMLEARDMERGLATSYSLSDLYRKDSRRWAPCNIKE